jgi:hypothetical protein
MIGHQMTTAFFAVLALTDRSLLVHADDFPTVVIRTESGFQSVNAFTGPH